MRTGLASARDVGGLDRVDEAVRALEEEWQDGEPTLERHWARQGTTGSVTSLAALIKADLRCRYARGDHPAVAEYLERFPELRADAERVLSLIYEEFCLREERGEHPAVDEFCDRYAPWRDSLASQLGYHQLLSRVAAGSSPAPRFPEPGERFEDFQLLSRLGQGGAAQVFLARDESLAGREVALKISRDTGCEPSILGRLEHDNIIHVFSVRHDRATGLRGLCMRYRAGLPLDKIIAQVRPEQVPESARDLWRAVVPPGSTEPRQPAKFAGWKSFPVHGTYAEGVAWVVATLARALAYAHSLDILHSDVKPANVLLTLRDGPQLLDFNLARDPHSADRAGAALSGGTLPYMAPEQLHAFLDPQAWDQVGKGADIYGLGLVLREMLTGEPPDLPNLALPLPRAIRDLLDRRAEASRPTALRRINPSIPYALEAIVERCLAHAPEDRYPDASTLASDLDRFLKRQSLRYAVNTSRRERAGNWLRRNWKRLGVGAVLSLVACAALAWWLTPRFIPVQSRDLFQQARLDLDEQSYPRAVDNWTTLVRDYPHSPIALFYLSYALTKNKDPVSSARVFARALGASPHGKRSGPTFKIHPEAPFLDPSTQEEFLAFAGGDPSRIARQLGELGKEFLSNKWYILAQAAYQVALLVDSQSLPANMGMVDLLMEQAKYDQDFGSIRDRLTSLIERRRARYKGSVDGRAELASLYRARASVAITRGEKLSPNARDKAKQHLIEAQQDLEQAGQLLNPNEPLETYQHHYFKAEVELALCEVDCRSGRLVDSQRHYDEAKRIIRDIMDLTLPDKPRFDVLGQKLKSRQQELMAPGP